jgi:hypothetical protein
MSRRTVGYFFASKVAVFTAASQPQNSQLYLSLCETMPSSSAFPRQESERRDVRASSFQVGLCSWAGKFFTATVRSGLPLRPRRSFCLHQVDSLAPVEAVALDGAEVVRPTRTMAYTRIGVEDVDLAAYQVLCLVCFCVNSFKSLNVAEELKY